MRMRMQGLYNWGRTPIVADLYPDADSIQIYAYFQVCPSPGLSNHSVAHELTYTGAGAGSVAGAKIIPTEAMDALDVSIYRLVVIVEESGYMHVYI